MKQFLAVFLSGVLISPAFGNTVHTEGEEAVVSAANTRWDGSASKHLLHVEDSLIAAGAKRDAAAAKPAPALSLKPQTESFTSRLAHRLGILKTDSLPAVPLPPSRQTLSNAQFVSLVAQSGSLKELEAGLDSHGITFRNRREAIDFIKERWWAVQKLKRSDVLKSPAVSTGELPTLSISVYGTIFKLHGIVHGESGWIMPGLSPSEQLKSFIRERVRYYESRNEPCYFEEGFNSFFDLQLPQREISDQNLASYAYLSRTAGFVKFSLRALLGAVLVVPTLAIGFVAVTVLYFFIKFASEEAQQRVSESSDGSDVFVWKKALQEERFQHKVNELILAGKLPEPVDLEIDEFSDRNPKGWLDWMMSSGRIFPASAAERSLLTSILLITYGGTGSGVVHYIGGLHHISQIAYFLRHYRCDGDTRTVGECFGKRRAELIAAVQ